jgi:hypothetical protein
MMGRLGEVSSRGLQLLNKLLGTEIRNMTSDIKKMTAKARPDQVQLLTPHELLKHAAAVIRFERQDASQSQKGLDDYVTPSQDAPGTTPTLEDIGQWIVGGLSSLQPNVGHVKIKKPPAGKSEQKTDEQENPKKNNSENVLQFAVKNQRKDS